MILTVTLNPGIDMTLEVERLQLGRTNRSCGLTYAAGGKGVNVSRLLQISGVQTEAMIVLGGNLGDFYLSLASDWEFDIHCFRTEYDTRINTVITDRQSGKHTKIDQEGAKLSRDEIRMLRKQVEELSVRADSVLFAGGLPPLFPVSAYREMIRAAREAGARVFVDQRGKALRAAIEEKVFLLKPNKSELEEVTGVSIRTPKTLQREAKNILSRGVENLVVTWGEKGAWWFCEKGAWFSEPADESDEPTLAAGDSTMAGILLALQRGESEPVALRWGSAMGCATALSKGTSLASPMFFRRILRRTTVEPVSG